MKLCEQCVNKVAEDQEICPQCESFSTPIVDWPQKEKELKKIFENHKRKADGYDAIVPLSGGKDSSYILYYMTKVLNLKVVAFTWDNYLLEDGALKNVENAVKATGAHLELKKWDFEVTKALYRSFFKTYGRICFCLPWIKLFILPLAAKYDIPFVMAGESEGQREYDHSFTLPDQQENIKAMKKFYKFFRRQSLFIAKRTEPQMAERIKEEMFGPMDKLMKNEQQVEKMPIFVPTANYVNWSDKDRVKGILEKELNWKNPVDMFLHTNCWFEPIKGYMEYKKNLNESHYELSNIIRIGGITREEALEDMKQMCLDGKRPDDRIKRFCEMINITEEEFDKLIGKTHMFENKLMNWFFYQFIEPKINKIAAWHFGLGEEHHKMFSVHGIGKM